jgi:hypothetical protein
VTALLVVVRLLVAGLLLFGPWTDDARDLAGWDVERFEAIADAPGRAWRDHPVEYPPGSVVVIEALGGDGVVALHQRLVVLLLLVDLGVAFALDRWVGRSAANAWLALGLLLLPAPYLRLDLLAAALALLAVLAVERRRPGLAGGLAAAGALVKLWPALLVVAWAAAREWRAVRVALVTGGGAGLAWLAWGGRDGPSQVLGYRGAEGWHVESVPGVVAGWFGAGRPALEQGAFRWGHADQAVRLVLLAALAAVVVAVLRRAGAEPRRQHLAMVTLVAAMLVTSPLLSPQYLLWLFPFAALCWADGDRRPACFSAVAALLTAAVLAAVGPPDVDGAGAQAVLALRNLVLVALVVDGLVRLSPSAAERPVPAR